MPAFAINLTWAFTEYPLMDRFEKAARAGFAGVELHSPYDAPAQAIRNECLRHGLEFVVMNSPPPNYTGGAPGDAAVPGLEARFQQDFKRSLRYAGVLGAAHLHLVAGDVEGEAARATYIKNLTWAADHAPGQSLVIEPLNAADHPGYFLSDFHVAREIIAEVDRPNVRLEFDAYHAQVIHGDAVALWDEMRDISALVQVAQTPHRHEPDKGEIDHPAFFAQLAREGFEGWVSGEYHPASHTVKGLGWLPPETC